MSAITQVYAMFNGQKVTAITNDDGATWTIETSAPSESSWNQPDHVYPVELHAVDAAGNEATMGSDDPTYGDQLKIRVLEKTKPVATIVSPTNGSVLGSSTQNIVMEIQAKGSSGLNMESVVFKVNDATIPNESLTWTDGEDEKKTCTYQATGLSDGSNTVSLQVSDNDGNVSDVATTTFIVSTAAPNLNITSPADNLITNKATVSVTGVATPGSEAVTITSVTVNGNAAEVQEDGQFTYSLSLTEGTNKITIIATDSVGKTTTVTRTVTLDTKAPVISDVVAVSTTVNAGGQVKITFKVVDPAE